MILAVESVQTLDALSPSKRKTILLGFLLFDNHVPGENGTRKHMNACVYGYAVLTSFVISIKFVFQIRPDFVFSAHSCDTSENGGCEQICHKRGDDSYCSCEVSLFVCFNDIQQINHCNNQSSD